MAAADGGPGRMFLVVDKRTFGDKTGGMREPSTMGTRIAWHRRRRGMSQEVLAGLVGRTSDWLSKVENGRIILDRLSVIGRLADALDVPLGQLIDGAAPGPAANGGRFDAGPLCAAVTGYATQWRDGGESRPPARAWLRHRLDAGWRAYQNARYSEAARVLPQVLAGARGNDDDAHGGRILALAYHAAASVLTKVGERDTAWLAADRGLAAAQRSEDPTVVGSLSRSVAHCLLSRGDKDAAAALTADASDYLAAHTGPDADAHRSVRGTLLLVGAMAAARADDRAAARSFLRDAGSAAGELGRDANHVWTSFGPTNVAIHHVAVAMELGDVQTVLDRGTEIDATGMPLERQVRHQLDVARALNAAGRPDDALAVVLACERRSPEQVRHHPICRTLVASWIGPRQGQPSWQLAQLAGRLNADGAQSGSR